MLAKGVGRRLQFLLILAVFLGFPTPFQPAATAAPSLDTPTGNARNIPTGAPVQTADPTGITSIAAGNHHTCVMTGSGGVQCWGSNQYGQLGVDTGGASSAVPLDVPGLAVGVRAVSAGGFYNCAIMNSGGLKCWGSNSSGQLGDGTRINRPTPVDVMGLTSGVRKVDAGGSHTCAITESGGAVCWGNNARGQLGNGSVNEPDLPVNPVGVVGLSAGVSDISVGSYHTCALLQTGTVKCWGSNDYGKLGNGTNSDSPVPVEVIGLGAKVIAINTRLDSTCALTDSGGVKCWGSNNYGSLGDGTNANRPTPVDVVGLTSGVSAIAAGNDFMCALMQTGAVQCWGNNEYGQLGVGSNTWYKSSPVEMVGVKPGMTQVAAGAYHTCLSSPAGAAQCVGANNYGQLGDGTTMRRFFLVDVVGFPSAGRIPWTVMVYAAGDNDLEMALKEELGYLYSAVSNPNVQVVVMVDDPNSPGYYEARLPNRTIGKYSTVEWNTGDPQRLRDFVLWSRQNVPAQHYALVIADHGHGLRGMAVDRHPNNGQAEDRLTPKELRAALSGTGYLDIVYAHTCLMANLESAYELRDVAGYYVASQSLAWGPSRIDWALSGNNAYNIPALTASTTGRELALAFMDAYAAYTTIRLDTPGTISVVQLNQVEALAQSTSQLAGFIRAQLPGTLPLLLSIHDDVQRYEETGDYKIVATGWQADRLVDLYHFADLLESKTNDSVLKTAAQAVQNAVDAAVVAAASWDGIPYGYSGDEYTWDFYPNSHGVAIFFPRFSLQRSYYSGDFLNFAAGTTWQAAGGLGAAQVSAAEDSPQWGLMLADAVQHTDPAAPEDENPPEPLILLEMEWQKIYLPAVTR